MSEYSQTERTAFRRLPKRGTYDRATVHAILDEGLICHVGFVMEGQPGVIPTAYAREGDWLYLHGSAKNRALLAIIGAPVCVEVTLLDGLVLARSAFHHSINYRSVVVYGEAEEVTERAEKARVLDLIVDHIVPGRTADARPGNEKELRATLVVRLPLNEVSAKVRTGPPADDEEDLAIPAWAGLLPARTAWGPLEPAPDLGWGIATPDYLNSYARPSANGSEPTGE